MCNIPYVCITTDTFEMTSIFPGRIILESLSMTFMADGKRQRVPLNFYSLPVILK